MNRIGFIGLGIMGESMCKNIIEKGNYKVLVYDIDNERVRKLTKIGGIATKSIKAIGEKCNIIFSMVPKDKDVKAVYKELLQVINEGTILIDMSTITPLVSIELSKCVSDKKCYMIDAPVVKSKSAAIKGDLGIYVGGNKTVYENIKPILEFMGNDIIYMGDNGSGLTMKICHNMLVAQIQNGVNEMITLAERSGLNFDDVITAIGYGGGQNFYLDAKKNAIKNSDFKTAFSIGNMNKDINIAVNMAKELGLKLQGTENIKRIYEQAIENGLTEKDFSSTIEVVRETTKLD